MASFASLPPRPPTPPKETKSAIDDALQFLDTSSDSVEELLNPQKDPQPGHVGLNTPPTSSPSRSSGVHGQLAEKHKRIRFVPVPSFVDDTPAEGTHSSNLRTLPPSKDQKSSKSILKPFEPSNVNETPSAEPSLTSIAPHHFESFAAMLESLLKQLAGDDRTSRLHAYMTLSGSIKAYGESPELETLQEKMPFLERFLQRDIAAVHPDTEAPDTKIRTQALKCASTLMWRTQSSQAFSNDFMSFLLDHSIKVLENASIPKEVIVNQMYLLTSRKLFGRTMNTEAVGKILAALKDIHERVAGTNVVCLRVSIYHQLIVHAPSFMIEKAESWLENLLSSMLSSINETSQRAVDAGLVAGLTLGNSKRMAQAVRHLFLESTSKETSPFSTHCENKLSEFIAKDDEKHKAPGIWSILMLLARANQRLLHSLLRSNGFLRVIEKCFNSGDVDLISHAFDAWDRAIYAAYPSIATSDKLVKIFRPPIVATFQRRSTSENIMKSRERAFSTYCMLLYYSFGSTSQFNELTLLWKELVEPFFVNTMVIDKDDLHAKSTLLAALVSESSLKIWRAERAVEMPRNVVSPEEVPRIHPQWIRDNTVSVLKVVECLIFRTKVSSSDFTDACVDHVWRSLLNAISQAGSKEVTTSQELKTSIAEILNFIYRIFVKANTIESSESTIKRLELSQLGNLMFNTVEQLGAVHMAEKVLLQTEFGKFEPTTSPSARKKSASSIKHSPIVAMIKLLSKWPISNEQPSALESVVKDLLGLFRSQSATPEAWFALLHDCADVLPMSPDQNKENISTAQVWKGVIETCTASLEDNLSSYPAQTVPQMHHCCQHLLKILEHGFQYSDQELSAAARFMCSSLQSYMTPRNGEASYFVSFIHPLAKSLSQIRLESYNIPAFLSYTSWILQASSQPPARTVVEHVLKTLNTELTLNNDGACFKVLAPFFDHLDCILNRVYKRQEKISEHGLLALLDSYSSFFKSWANSEQDLCTHGFLLNGFPNSLDSWIRDEYDKLNAAPKQTREALLNWISSFWSMMLKFMTKCFQDGTLPWDGFSEPVSILVKRGLRSRHKAIVNTTVDTWNTTFGDNEYLSYPGDLAYVLLRAAEHIDIQIPEMWKSRANSESFNSPYHGLKDLELFPWLSNEEDDGQEMAKEDLYHRFSSPLPTAKRNHKSLESTPQMPATRLQYGQTPPPRLRHDDSQMQFVPIDSSPLGADGDASQNLTEHQKDVRSRQEQDMAIFSNLHSTPSSSKVMSSGLHQKNEAEISGVGSSDNDNERITNTARLALNAVEGFSGPDSSPLGGRKDVNTLQRIEKEYDHLVGVDDDVDQDMPSSPPEIRQNKQTNELSIEVNNLVAPAEVVDQGDENVIDENAHEFNTESQSTSVEEAKTLKDPEDDDDEVFVDAVTSPINRRITSPVKDSANKASLEILSPIARHLQELSPNMKSSFQGEQDSGVKNNSYSSNLVNEIDSSVEQGEDVEENLHNAVDDLESSKLNDTSRQGSSQGIESTVSDDVESEDLQDSAHIGSDEDKEHTSQDPEERGVRYPKRKISRTRSAPTYKKRKLLESSAEDTKVQPLSYDGSNDTDDDDDVIIVRPRAPDTPTTLQLLTQRQPPSSSQPKRRRGRPSGTSSSLKRSISASEEPNETSMRGSAQDNEGVATRSIAKRMRFVKTEPSSQEDTLQSSQRERGGPSSHDIYSPAEHALQQTRSQSKATSPSQQNAQQDNDEDAASASFAVHTDLLPAAQPRTSLPEPPSAAPPAEDVSPEPSLARSLVTRLGRILGDARALILRPRDDVERRQLEDLSFDLHREIVQAGRRGEEV